MSAATDHIRALLGKCSEQERLEIFKELRATIKIHDFEGVMNAKAEVILEALHRSSNLTQLGIRGIVGKATFLLEEAKKFAGWESVPFSGDQSYDAIYRRKGTEDRVTVQVKMQRREKGLPKMRNGNAVVEVQRTRGGKTPDGKDTRPYKFSDFDILAVCMEPSHKKWESFLYIPAKWLKPRPKKPLLIEIMQEVPLSPDGIWTDDFQEAVRRLRSGKKRPPRAEVS